MAKTVSMVGIDPAELEWVRMLLLLLRHPDPMVPELTRQAVLYLTDHAGAPVGHKKLR
jgi:hypothetical protein